jgi:cation diffusion facilitator CzcD-associated flavoprotein CzcO
VDSSHLDVLIVGAGISGIGAAYHLQTSCPNKTFAILEGRERLGGTWDLFRYPGIRSDSDMYTLGYSFRPWTQPKAIADGPSILDYVRQTAEEHGIDRKIRYSKKVEPFRLTCSFLFMCAGYYDYEEGYTPDLPGRERFQGRIVHPQKWTSDIGYEGKRVVVIGSGATAMTLVPEMAKTAAHVTMLQRSPTYILSVPASDRLANWLRAKLPARTAYSITRWKNVLLGMAFFSLSRRFPARVKKVLVGNVRKAVGDGVDAAHFTPSYNPWDQRVCLVPDGDMFEAVRAGSVSVVTDQIDTFTETGIRLKSGQELPADLVVTATGLKLKFLGGLEVEVDGKRVEPSKTMAYKGMMCSDVPNMALAFGYTNASWTLKCDLTCEYVCRLLQHMDKHGYTKCCPRRTDPSLKEEPLLDFSSGYVQRSIDKFPRQGTFAPWRVYQNYALDRMMLKHQRVDDGVMEFSRPDVRG